MEVEPLLVFCLAVNLFTSRPWTTSISIHITQGKGDEDWDDANGDADDSRLTAAGQCVDPWSGSAANGH